MISLLPHTIVDIDCVIDFNFSFRFLLDALFFCPFQILSPYCVAY